MVIIFLLLLLLLYFILRSRGKEDTSILLLRQQMETLRGQVNEGLNAASQKMDRLMMDIISQINQQMGGITQQLQITTGQIGERLDNASKIIADVKGGLGEVSEANKRIIEIAKDIAQLQDLLKPPKSRGGMGEVLLENLLNELVPGKFKRQYRFRDGSQVDFVISLRDRLVPVDSKFPLESFRKLSEAKTDDERKRLRKEFIRDIKKHIDGVTKYIKPDENTFDFAMMYIPAEGIYYETIIREEDERESLFEYAFKKRVVPVSPNTFFAYLMTIVLGFRGMEIEKNAMFVLDTLARLHTEIENFRKEFDTLGGHLKNAVNKYEEIRLKFSKIDNSITGLTKMEALPSGEK